MDCNVKNTEGNMNETALKSLRNFYTAYIYVNWMKLGQLKQFLVDFNFTINDRRNVVIRNHYFTNITSTTITITPTAATITTITITITSFLTSPTFMKI